MAAVDPMDQFMEQIREFDQTYGLNLANALGMYGDQNTLAKQQGLGFDDQGRPFLNTMVDTGVVTMPDGTTMPTEQAREFNLGNANNISQMVLNSNATAQADPFGYLAKYAGLGSSPLGSYLGGAISGATGRSISSLQNEAPYSNANLAMDLANAQTGQPISSSGQSFLASLGLGGGGSTGSGGSGAAASNVAGSSPDPTTQALINALHMSQPAGAASTTSGTGTPPALPPTGYQTSMQQFNNLSPSGQNALTDFTAVSGGQNPTDFLAGMKQAAPEFARTGNAQLGNVSL